MYDKEPHRYFKDNAELQSYLKEWKRVLYLDDWVISAELVDHTELVIDGEELVGINNFCIENKVAHIRIAKEGDYTSSLMLKYCGELVLVHELLHCKRNWLQAPNTMEGKFFDTLNHQSLEEEARSYLLARYNITKEWFSNLG